MCERAHVGRHRRHQTCSKSSEKFGREKLCAHALASNCYVINLYFQWAVGVAAESNRRRRRRRCHRRAWAFSINFACTRVQFARKESRDTGDMWFFVRRACVAPTGYIIIRLEWRCNCNEFKYSLKGGHGARSYRRVCAGAGWPCADLYVGVFSVSALGDRDFIPHTNNASRGTGRLESGTTRQS